ncbi:MAG: hypothetical protein JW885_04795 [Deltaproteobacteria bacterium]|nr:hypothetical protein [Candidatus Zymogenaceae bacterium]
MKSIIRKLLFMITMPAVLFLLACPGERAGGGEDAAKALIFDSGGAYHIQGLGAWRALLTGDGVLSISHETAGDVVDYGDFTLTNDEAARLWDAVTALDIPSMSPEDRPGVPDEVRYTFILEDGENTHDVSVWINDARDMPGMDEFLTLLSDLIETYTGEKPVLR